MSLRDLTKNIHNHHKALLISAIMVFVSSCEDITQAKSNNLGARSVTTYGDGNGLVYETNPAVLNNNLNITRAIWTGLLTPANITDNFYLEEKCQYFDPILNLNVTSQKNCLQVKNDKSQETLIQKVNNSWTFTDDSDEFYQVNTFYHVNKIQKRFLASLSSAQNIIHSPFLFNTLAPALPSNIGETGVFWWDEISSESTYLTVYSKCYLDSMNAFFDPSTKSVCLGWNENDTSFRMAQDPSVIYHEMGHTFVKVMMNLRNSYKDGFTYTGTDFKSELGGAGYDEAGSINEGIADFFSYYITNRKHIGEWAMARFGADRPMEESNILHSGRIPAKLSYPEFLHYNAVSPEDGAEDIHNSGQIISHYLVSLTQNFKDVCFANMNYDTNTIHRKSTDLTVMLLSETLAEIGDMTAKGSDFLSQFYMPNPAFNELFFTNLNSDESYLWAHQITPPNFRRFFRIFGKNINQYISDVSAGVCPAFSQDNSETLLDDYGLLLFKSYKDAGQGIDLSGTPTTKKYVDVSGATLSYSSKQLVPKLFNSEVSEANRKNTVLVSKDYISLPSDSRPTAFVFDGQAFMKEYLASLTFEGKSINLSQGLAAPEYNNGNVKISPGEVVGVSLNLVNNANSTMAGVQILANDWDHMKMNDTSKTYINTTGNLVNQSANIAHWEPCQIDGWPLQTEGGVVPTSGSPVPGDCDYTSRSNKAIDANFVGSGFTPEYEPKYDLDSPQPICMVQYSDENESKWVSQDFFRTRALDLADKDCLNNSPTGSGVGIDYNPNECLIRMLPGANQAILGKIDPQKTWSETLAASTRDGDVSFSASTIVVMEVNKWIQPGTTFNCRFRTRFTNCQDCFNNNNSGNDYNDYEYAGEEPFKVINFSFTVID
jgi:hypothetical protein